jgi:hypothetical protein
MLRKKGRLQYCIARKIGNVSPGYCKTLLNPQFFPELEVYDEITPQERRLYASSSWQAAELQSSSLRCGDFSVNTKDGAGRDVTVCDIYSLAIPI